MGFFQSVKNLEIEPLKASQTDLIVKLDRLCLGGLWTEDGYLREIDSSNSYLVGLHLSETADSPHQFISRKMIGFACLWSIINEAHITLLAIHPEYRRQSFGQLLLLNLLTDAIARKLEWATLEVNINNLDAISLYQKFGFEVVGTRKRYYQANGEDALILWKKDIQSSKFQLDLATRKQKIENLLRQHNYKFN